MSLGFKIKWNLLFHLCWWWLQLFCHGTLNYWIFWSKTTLSLCQQHLHSCSRYKDNRHVSMGAEKWLDIELWSSIHECFKVLKSRGYRIATTHVGMDAVLINLSAVLSIITIRYWNLSPSCVWLTLSSLYA